MSTYLSYGRNYLLISSSDTSEKINEEKKRRREDLSMKDGEKKNPLAL